jgi:hypothetical protein
MSGYYRNAPLKACSSAARGWGFSDFKFSSSLSNEQQCLSSEAIFLLIAFIYEGDIQ